MPHKHRRDKINDNPSCYDLPPSKSAHSLPAKRAKAGQNTQSHSKPTKHKHARLDDDTPKAFTRLLAAYRPPRSGLDDGNRPSKKRKTSKPTVETKSTNPPPLSLPVPSIQPHEPLSSFNARVDAALPFSGLTRGNGGNKQASQGRKTKTERKMQKMQNEWRKEEQRRKEKLEEKEEEVDNRFDGHAVDDIARKAKKGKQKGAKRSKGDDVYTEDLDDDDPWAHIKTKRAQESSGGTSGGLVGLHDVVQAPPKLSKVPKGKNILKTERGSGGLKWQGELSEARKSVIESYRQMMVEKRAKDE